ncbi:hypothetical protein CWI42_081700 [Ordospora colligata]|uniref:RRM domain-containing protein n=1 Tax=Ordospora colligata OC4 TaxID=1354746 RepID=A0A0B2UKA0_9MICR|nr:uncharacterized protein M896_081700 [Ordospora colligata OC4]KHN69430.1 hypothetical protein M896_081700 [Ordospora colligata OC4]TBU14944.1 hypothetical protein CWI41_081690 [Ordospora colligata]TBU15075.1 hypothetical protein CWI40_081710 [Ordospora colligata]TBU18329.1 hypothetical protein CWI42_081700 [Ordospora colligata]
MNDSGSYSCTPYQGINSPDAHKLFVTNIPSKVGKHLIYELLIQVSKVESLYYNQTKGYCFATYKTHSELEYTCNVLKGVKLYGKRIYFGMAEQQSRVIVKNIGSEVDDVLLWNVFSKFGSCYVEITDQRTALITYRKKEHASRAVSIGNGQAVGNSNVIVEHTK